MHRCDCAGSPSLHIHGIHGRRFTKPNEREGGSLGIQSILSRVLAIKTPMILELYKILLN